MREIFRSNPANVNVHTAGWVRLPSGVWVTMLPLFDSAEGIFARCSPFSAAARCDRLGVRIASVGTIAEVHRVGFHLEPIVYPTTDMLRAEGVPLTQAAIQAFRVAHMESREWCAKHDAEAIALLASLGWDGRTAVDGFGKHWVVPPKFTAEGHPWPAGMGCIFGWFTVHAQKWGAAPGATMIQNIGSKHEAGTTEDNSDGYPGDYATTFHAECDDPLRLALANDSIAPVA